MQVMSSNDLTDPAVNLKLKEGSMRMLMGIRVYQCVLVHVCTPHASLPSACMCMQQSVSGSEREETETEK